MTEPREMQSRDARRDNPARFLRELRQLRNQAGLNLAELAARAHYPFELIKAAEAGPELPDLPVLSAYVRGCGGTPSEWEERWRAVTGSPASPLLPTRGAGWSEAADAGARVGAAAVGPADGQDPDRVMAALNRVADGMAASVWDQTSASDSVWDPAPKSPAVADPVWDPAPSVWNPAALTDPVWDAPPAADPAWDAAPAIDPVWDAPRAVDPVWDAPRAADPVWDAPPAAAAAWDPVPQSASAFEPVPKARPASPSRSAAPAGTPRTANDPADSPKRGLPSWRVFVAIVTVALIVVATLLALST